MRLPEHLKRAVAAGVLAWLAAAGCAEAERYSASDIENAVERYLSGRTDLEFGRLTVRADRIRYSDDRAVATVSIIASDDPQATMQMLYELERTADGWRVVPPRDAGGEGGGPPAASEQGSGLPPGHPPTTPRGDGLPPGHPPLPGSDR